MKLGKAVNHRVHREKSRVSDQNLESQNSEFSSSSTNYFLCVLCDFARTPAVFGSKASRLLDLRHVLAVLSLALFCSLPAVSWGHAFPDHSDPRVGSTVAVSPAQVRIWFDSDLEPAFCKIMVHNANNEMVDKKDGHVDPSNPTLLQVSLPKLPPGTYMVMWNVVARDGHRTTGDFSFTVK